MGDPYRAYLISRQREGHSYAQLLGTLVAERVVDAVTFAAILLLVGALLWADASGATIAVIGLAVFIGGGGVFLIVGMALFGRRVTARLPGLFREWMERLRVGAVSSLNGRLTAISALSVGAWRQRAAAPACDRALGLDVPLPVIAFVALAHNLITAIPATPGGLGLAEAGMVGLLLPWMREDAAVLTALDRSYPGRRSRRRMAWREGVKRGRYNAVARRW